MTYLRKLRNKETAQHGTAQLKLRKQELRN